MSPLRPALLVVCIGAGAVPAQQFQDLGRRLLPNDPESTWAVVLADLDGDRHADLCAGNGGGSQPSQSRLYKNDGRGGFIDVTAASLPLRLGATTSLAAGDVDGDGDLDLVLGELGQNRLYENDGRGRFADVTSRRLASANDATAAVLLVDVDGDGDLDLCAGNGGQNALHANDGRGSFTDVTIARLPQSIGTTHALAAADLDRDGDVDVVAANGGVGGAQNWIYRNEGGGRFVNATTGRLPLVNDDSRAVVIVDVNRDGLLDLCFGNHGNDRLLLNLGQLRFQEVTLGNLPALGGQTEAMLAADVDRDGDADLLLGELGGLQLLSNDGRGSFRVATATRVKAQGAPVRALALADVDCDDDADLVCGVEGGGNRMLLDLSRQIDAPAPPVAGQGLPVDFYALPGMAPAGELVAVYASAGLAPVPLAMPPFGAFRLDLASLAVGNVRPIPAGTGALRVVYQLVPGLAGHTVYVQGLFLHGASSGAWRFSNVLRLDVR